VVTSGPGSAQQAVGDLGRLYQEQFDLEILYPVEQSAVSFPSHGQFPRSVAASGAMPIIAFVRVPSPFPAQALQGASTTVRRRIESPYTDGPAGFSPE
jgi:hypothetical protein